MKRLILALLATAVATPAIAQHAGHNMPGMTMPEEKAEPKRKPAAKKKAPAKKKATAKKPAAKKASQKPAAKPKPANQKAGEHAGHQMPAEPAPADAHADHDMQGMEMGGQHAGHDMSQMAAPEPQPGPPPPEAFSGPAWAADTYFPDQPQARHLLEGEHGSSKVGRFLVDRAETRFTDGKDGYLVDIQAWHGGDLNKLWLKGEYEGTWGKKLGYAETQALWSHAIGPWFDLQAGARFDAQTGPNRGHLVLGVEGLAPYWFEVEAAAFLSNKGDLTARAEGEYDLRITQKLILQPRAEMNLSAQDIPELRIGAGLTDAELGLRLRYEITPQFAPYLGVEYERAFGNTRDFIRADGDDPDGLQLIAGVRAWF